MAFPGRSGSVASYSPTLPSINSRTTSRCPTCRAYSCSRWMSIQPSVGGSLENRPPSRARWGQLCLAGNRLSACRDGRQPCGQIGDSVPRRNEPTLRVWVVVAPRVGDRLGFEAPLHPAPLDEDQVLEKPEWRPARREDAGGQLGFAETLELGEQSGPVVAQLLQQDCPRILERWWWFVAKLTHEGEANCEKFVHGADGVEFTVGSARCSLRRSIRPPAMGPSHSRSSPEEVEFAHA
jgi:hypothetical protein